MEIERRNFYCEVSRNETYPGRNEVKAKTLKTSPSNLENRGVRAIASPEVAPRSKSRAMHVFLKPGETEDRAVAGLVARGLVTNASTVIRFLESEHNDLSLMDMARELRDQGEAVNRGDFSGSERMLNAQAVTLNAIFAEMCRRAALNMGEHLSATEIYMRLALKAQSQCRATFETLAAMKNPPLMFARQANFANGPQQVNNGAPVNRPMTGERHARAANSETSAERTFRGLDE